jgi:hypothetical protein
LSQWKLDKNVKLDEMKAIVRKRQHRRIIETSKKELNFRIRGDTVPPQKIDRWIKSYGISEHVVYAPSPAAGERPGTFCSMVLT